MLPNLRAFRRAASAGVPAATIGPGERRDYVSPAQNASVELGPYQRKSQ
jgi:hypothetical protein